MNVRSFSTCWKTYRLCCWTCLPLQYRPKCIIWLLDSPDLLCCECMEWAGFTSWCDLSYHHIVYEFILKCSTLLYSLPLGILYLHYGIPEHLQYKRKVAINVNNWPALQDSWISRPRSISDWVMGCKRQLVQLVHVTLSLLHFALGYRPCVTQNINVAYPKRLSLAC